MSGLTENGFEAKTFAQIISEIEEKYIAAFGNIDLESESVVGQQIGISSAALAEIWAAAEAIYNAQFVDTATGISLDYACSAIGLSRLRATATTAETVIRVVNGTTLTRGVEVRSSNSDVIFRSNNDITITNSACIASLVTVQNNTELSYIITLDGTPYEYTPFIIDQVPQIVDGLLLLINAAPNGFTALPSGEAGITISSDTQEEFSIVVSSGIGVTSVSNFLSFTSTVLGDIPLPANTLTTIVTPLVGWLGVNNPNAGSSGRDAETDNEFRVRWFQSLRLGGSGSVEAIRANLRNVPGVIVADVTENKTINVVDGLPPKSFNCIVLGGNDTDIANVIWQKKPAGIEDFGNIQVNIQDSEGVEQAVYFSRPTPVYIYIKVTLTLDNTNDYPLNGGDVIEQGCLDIIKLLNVGDDVIYQSFFRAIYAVDGIESAIVEIGGTTSEFVIPTLSSANIAISPSETAVSDLTKIEVIVV